MKTWKRFGLAMLMAALGQTAVVWGQIRFTNVGPQTHTQVGCNTHGSGFFDYNGDGWEDIFVVHNVSTSTWGDGHHYLLKNMGDGTFTEVSAQASLSGYNVSAQGMAAADYNNDGHMDIAVAMGNWKVTLYRNRGTGSFENVTDATGVGYYNRARVLSFSDYNNDGWVDLFLFGDPTESLGPSVIVYENRGDGTFSQHSADIGLGHTRHPEDPWGVAFGDIDNDGDMDFFEPNVEETGKLFVNNGNGTFSEKTLELGVDRINGYQGAIFFDYNNDGWIDLYARRRGDMAKLYKNNGDGTFVDVAASAWVAEYLQAAPFGGGLSAADFDNDGYMDLLAICRQGDYHRVYRNNGNGTFSNITQQANMVHYNVIMNWSAPLADYNQDGYVDIYLARNEAPPPTFWATLYQNDGGTNHWSHVKLVGVQSNRAGIGSRLVAYAGGKLMMRQVLGGDGYKTDSFPAEFGLGTAVEVDSLVIYWPSGNRQKVLNIPCDRMIVVEELAGVMDYSEISGEDLPPIAVANGPYTGTEGSEVTFDASGSQDFGGNKGIVEYAWDWDSDGVFDITTPNQQVTHVFNDDFSGEVTLRITDNGGFTDEAFSTVQITNLPPAVEVGQDQTLNEGQSGTFAVQITDPGTEDTHTVVWDLGDGQAPTSLEVSRLFRDDWSGYIRVTVTDDDGGVARDSLYVTVLNLPPTLEITELTDALEGEELQLAAQGDDPGVQDTLAYSWDLDDDGTFETPGQQVVIAYQGLGRHRYWAKLDDGDGGTAIDSASVWIRSAAPAIATIPDQTINDGESFTPIALDDYVTDLNNAKSELTWQVDGYQDLSVWIDQRVVHVETPSAEWNGFELLRFIVTDPAGLADTTQVLFTVLQANDPPYWKVTPQYTIYEDDKLTIPLTILRTFVDDPDDALTTLVFSMLDNVHTQWSSDNVNFVLTLDPDWYGQEPIRFLVKDPHGGADTCTVILHVLGRPDSPLPFSLLTPLNLMETAWPDSVEFSWEATADPDSHDTVSYVWNLAPQGVSIAPFKKESASTRAVFYPPATIEAGSYRWWVEAVDNTGNIRVSRQEGQIHITGTGVEGPDDSDRPDTFRMLGNYPNPFNPGTVLAFELPAPAQVTVTVYDVMGRQVRRFPAMALGAGRQSVAWDGRDGSGLSVPSGIYFCCIQAGDQQLRLKVLKAQ